MRRPSSGQPRAHGDRFYPPETPIERRTAEPIMPLRLFGIANSTLATSLGVAVLSATFAGQVTATLNG